jgi:hypothetical protein
MRTLVRIGVIVLTVIGAQFFTVQPAITQAVFYQLKNIANAGCLYFKDSGDTKDFLLGIPCLDDTRWRIRMDGSPSPIIVEASPQRWFCLTVKEPIVGLRKRVEPAECVNPSTWFRKVQDDGSIRFILFREVQEVAFCLSGDAADGRIYIEHCGGAETSWNMIRLP